MSPHALLFCNSRSRSSVLLEEPSYRGSAAFQSTVYEAAHVLLAFRLFTDCLLIEAAYDASSYLHPAQRCGSVRVIWQAFLLAEGVEEGTSNETEARTHRNPSGAYLRASRSDFISNRACAPSQR
jgi:hypothetical protein